MFTTGSKWFFGLAAAALVAALIYGGATNPDEVGMSTFTGVLTFGYKGGVGEQLGYAVLMGLVGAGLFLGATSAAFRDASVEAGAELLERETVPEVVAPAHGSYWPIIGAFGVGTATVGLVTARPLVMLGVVVVVAAAFEWAVSAWAERATGDPVVNQAIRRRVMMPVEVPVLGALGIAAFVLSISRIMLAVPQLGVYILFGAVPLLVLIVAFILAARPRINRSVVAGLCVVAAVAILAGGVASAIVGPRPLEHEEGEEGEGGDHEGAPALRPDLAGAVRGNLR